MSPLLVYECAACKTREEKFYHLFSESPSTFKCECGNVKGRLITGDNRIWIPKLTTRLKKIFAKEKNRQYQDSQKSFPNTTKVYTSKRRGR